MSPFMYRLGVFITCKWYLQILPDSWSHNYYQFRILSRHEQTAFHFTVN